MQTGKTCYVCFKQWRDGQREEHVDEILGVFSTAKKAECFAKEFPKISMDDPLLFRVCTKKMQVNKNVWGEW